MAKPLVLATEIYAAEALTLLQTRADVEVSTDPSQLARAEALLIRSRTKIDEHMLARTPQMKLVVTATSGFDHIDYKLCEKKNIQVAYTPEANAPSAAELAITLMLNLTRHVPLASKVVDAQKWRDQVPRGSQLQGLSLGIIGLGRVGRRVAKLGEAFGMRILACDPYVRPEDFKAAHAEPLAYSEILLAADVLSLHVPLTKETRRMINGATLKNMNTDAYLINTARGELVDELELVTALTEGLIRGAALDVFEKEPPANDSRLRGRKNLLMTPHIGAYTEQAVRAASLQAVDNAVEFFKYGKILSPLPKDKEWFAHC